MIRVILPPNLRTLAHIEGEVGLKLNGTLTQRSLLDAVEAKYPMLRGTMRDHVTQVRRPMVRFFACGEDWSHESPDAPLPDAIANGAEPFLIIGAIAGGGKGAAIGAGAGAGAGTAGAAFTGNRDITIAPETKLSFKLKEPLEIKGK